MQSNHDNLKAVHEQDLAHLLGEIGLLDEFSSGGSRCKFCNTSVSIDNLYSLLSDSGAYKFVCDKAECVDSLLAYVEIKEKDKPNES